MQIRARVLLKQLKLDTCISVQLCWHHIPGGTVLIWMITSQGFVVIVAIQIRGRVLLKQTGATVLVCTITSWFYNNCCNADPCKGIAYTNWLCCHDSLGGTSLVWWISSQACSSSSFQSADDHIEVVKMCWHRYEDRVNINTRRRGVSSWICRSISSLIVFALCTM